jgi:hypothetical protein
VVPASLLLTGLLIPAPPAETLELRWDAPQSCPSGDDVRAQVIDAVGDPEEPRTEVLQAEGRIEQTQDGRWSLELTLAGSGTRTLDAGSCAELADAAVLIMAIAIDPDAIERLTKTTTKTAPESESESESEPESESASESESESEPEPEPEPESEPVRPKRAPPSVHVDVQLGAGAAFRILPDPGGWFAAGVGVWGRWWRVEIDGSYTTPSVEMSTRNPAVGGRMQLWSIAARGGPSIPAGPVEFPIAVGIEAGGMHGRGVGDLESSDGSQAPWVGFFGGAAALWRPRAVDRRLGFGLRVEGIAALTRPRFGTPESDTIYETRPGGARVFVLFTVRLR